MDWRYFLHVSEWLEPGPCTDAEDFKVAQTRTGISRAYFAAHNIARLHVRQKGYYFEREDGTRDDWPQHEQLWKVLQGSPKPEEKKAGVKGDTLRLQRNAADYDAQGRAESLRRDHAVALGLAYEICKLLGMAFPRFPPKK
jgi:hypothetical protein